MRILHLAAAGPKGLEESPDTRDSVQKVTGNARQGNPRDANRDVRVERQGPLRGAPRKTTTAREYVFPSALGVRLAETQD